MHDTITIIGCILSALMLIFAISLLAFEIRKYKYAATQPAEIRKPGAFLHQTVPQTDPMLRPLITNETNRTIRPARYTHIPEGKSLLKWDSVH